MPHVVFGGTIDFEKLIENFSPIFEKSANLIKVENLFLNYQKNNALFSTLVIDEFHQEFFIEVLTRAEKTTIRLFPMTDPKKTDSVKKSLVLVSQLIKNNYPELKITKTNLQDFLPKNLTEKL